MLWALCSYLITSFKPTYHSGIFSLSLSLSFPHSLVTPTGHHSGVWIISRFLSTEEFFWIDWIERRGLGQFGPVTELKNSNVQYCRNFSYDLLFWFHLSLVLAHNAKFSGRHYLGLSSVSLFLVKYLTPGARCCHASSSSLILPSRAISSTPLEASNVLHNETEQTSAQLISFCINTKCTGRFYLIGRHMRLWLLAVVLTSGSKSIYTPPPAHAQTHAPLPCHCDQKCTGSRSWPGGIPWYVSYESARRVLSVMMLMKRQERGIQIWMKGCLQSSFCSTNQKTLEKKTNDSEAWERKSPTLLSRSLLLKNTWAVFALQCIGKTCLPALQVRKTQIQGQPAFAASQTRVCSFVVSHFCRFLPFHCLFALISWNISIYNLEELRL